MNHSDTDRGSLSRRLFLGAGTALASTSMLGGASVAQAAAPANAVATPAPGMSHKRRLGPLEVSPMGLGCMSGSAFFYPLPGKARMISVIRQARDRGVTLFDTAELYGPFTNEEVVGEAIQPFRKDIVLASKFGFAYDGNQSTGADSRPSTIRRAVEGSLRRLRTDYIDLLELIEQPLLMMAGSKADSLYMTEDAFAKATGAKDKELFRIEGATHIETYWVPEYVDAAMGKLTPFFARTLVSDRS